jgi:5-methylcytosine-specific restriction endonuclease McrA
MPGWASRHRHVTSTTRAQVYRRYGLTGNHPFPQWEVDHRVPLELGGSNTITNLWPEHRPQTKDQLENTLHDQVCSGQIELARAQRIFKRDWRAYQ